MTNGKQDRPEQPDQEDDDDGEADPDEHLISKSHALVVPLHARGSSGYQRGEISPLPEPVSAPMSDASNLPSNGLSYKHAGVDIDAGNALVEAIKPAVRSTRRAGRRCRNRRLWRPVRPQGGRFHRSGAGRRQ